jgi:hypothetical protein
LTQFDKIIVHFGQRETGGYANIGENKSFGIEKLLQYRPRVGKKKKANETLAKIKTISTKLKHHYPQCKS